jgi:hypothetical protein
MRSARRKHLSNGRTMSYKRLDDSARQKALVPFLEAAAAIDGHLVAVAVDKKKKWLSTAKGGADDLRKGLALKATWNARALEAMLRKVQLTAILLSIWSRPFTDVTWITDDDDFVANDTRHDDALQAVARMSSLYFRHPMGVLRLNRIGQDPERPVFEDMCAIPDLAAGMLSEISTRLSRVGSWGDGLQKVLEDEVPVKTEVIADWFWDTNMRLRKTLISIDVEAERFAVRRVLMHRGEGSETKEF